MTTYQHPASVRTGRILSLGDSVIFVGPNPESRRGEPVLRAGRRGEEWKTYATFPNATAAAEFMNVLEGGAASQKALDKSMHNDADTQSQGEGPDGRQHEGNGS